MHTRNKVRVKNVMISIMRFCVILKGKIFDFHLSILFSFEISLVLLCTFQDSDNFTTVFGSN